MADVALNAEAMEQARKESEDLMYAEIQSLANTKSECLARADVLKDQADSLDKQAEAQEHIAATAMKTIYYTDSDGHSHSKQVPDTAARAAAAAAARELRAQSAEKRQQEADLRAYAAQLDSKINQMEHTILETNAYIAEIIEIIEQTDLSYAKRMEKINAATEEFNQIMENLYNSFNHNLPLTSSDINILNNGLCYGSATPGYKYVDPSDPYSFQWPDDFSLNDFLSGKYTTIWKDSIKGRISAMNWQGGAGHTWENGAYVYADGQIDLLTAAGGLSGSLSTKGLSLNAEGELAVLSAQGRAGFYVNDYFSGELSARGTPLSARASAGLTAGLGGTSAKVEAMAAVAEGEVKGKINLGNIIELNIGVNGYAAAIGGKAEAGLDYTTGELSFGASAAVGLGGGFSVGVKPTGVLADILGITDPLTDSKVSSGMSYSQNTRTVVGEVKHVNSYKDDTYKSTTVSTSYGSGVSQTTTSRNNIDKEKSTTSKTYESNKDVIQKTTSITSDANSVEENTTTSYFQY